MVKRPPLFINNGMVDDREGEMMAVRWKIFELKAQIPETSQRAIPPCSRDWVGQDVGVDVCDFAPHSAMLYGRNC